MNKRVLCAWLPNWPIQRLRAARSELDVCPVVLWSEVPSRGQRVVACSDEAIRCGVRIGAPLANVASLGQRMAREGHCEEHRPADDLAALEKLAVLCERFSPTVGLEQTVENEPPSSLLLNVTGLTHLFKSEQRLAEQLIAVCRRWRYTVQVAVADTVGAAWAGSHFVDHNCIAPTSSPEVAVIVPTGHWQIFDSLPTSALRLSPDTIDRLNQLGVTQIEQLLRLPRESLAARFGAQVARRIDQLFGDVEEPIIAHRHPPQLTAHWALEHPAQDADVLQHVLRQLLEQLAEQLAAAGLGAIELACRLRGESGRSVELPLYLFEPATHLPQLLNLFQLQWERRRLPGPVAQVEVEITVTAPLSQRQYELFAGQRDSPAELAALVNRLSNRLGHQQVVQPQLRGEAQPARAFRYLPLAGRRRSRSKTREASGNAGAGTLTNSATSRPLKLFSPPQAIEVVAVQPGGEPGMLHWQQRRETIARYWGPERIQTGWWRGRTVQRDYYRIETAGGDRYWIFRELTGGKWFLHGEFA